MLRRLPRRLLSNVVPEKRVPEVIVGLEVHAQLDIRSKLFAPPAKPFHPFDVAVPGTLPVLSQSAVRSAVLAAAALRCNIQETSRFERKHYFYTDLPHGYQITQQRWPLATGGIIHAPDSLSCRINRIQLEMDTGKSNTYGLFTRVDFDRAGRPLIEIVTEPDLRSSDDAVHVVTELRNILLHAKVCDGRMELGHLRVDVNVNIQRNGQRTPRVEVKNLNSLQQVRDSIEYETQRQLSTDYNHAETRTWNPSTKRTELLRVKDTAQDYRFLPEPDLPPLILNKDVLGTHTVEEFVQSNLPELPAAAYERLQKVYSLTHDQAKVLTNDPPAIAFFDLAAQATRTSKAMTRRVANLICNELIAVIKVQEGVENGSLMNSKVSPTQISEIVQLVEAGTLSKTMAKNLLVVLYVEEQGRTPSEVAKERGLEMIANADQLRTLCEGVMDAHLDELELYKQGGKYERKIRKFFLGKCMAASNGQAQPERLREVLFECMEARAKAMRASETTPSRTSQDRNETQK